jgi:hypothetical protein
LAANTWGSPGPWSELSQAVDDAGLVAGGGLVEKARPPPCMDDRPGDMLAARGVSGGRAFITLCWI